jgi:hypothetical protein
MTIETRWYVEGRVLTQRFSGSATIEDVKQSVENADNLFAQGTAPIHVIVDLLDAESWPPLWELSRVVRRSPHPKLGWTVLLVHNPMLRFIAALAMQFSGAKYYAVATLAEALKFLINHDSSLPSPTNSH